MLDSDPMRLLPLLVGLWASLVFAQGPIRVNHSNGLHVFPDGILVPFVAGTTNASPVDVRSFGALCNGSSDDTTAIQQALDTAGNGGRVVFPAASNCGVSAALLYYNGQDIGGLAQGGSDATFYGSKITALTPGMTIFQAKTKGTTRTDSPHIHHLVLVLNGSNGVGIDLTHVNEGKVFHDDVVCGASGQVGVLISSNQPTTISGGLGSRVFHNSIENCAYGVRLQRTANMNWVGPGNRIYNSTKYGIAVEGVCTAGTTFDCEADSDCNGGGTCSSVASGFSLNNHVVNNWLEKPTLAQVFDFGQSTVIAHNYMEPTPGVTVADVDAHGSNDGTPANGLMVTGNHLSVFANQSGVRLTNVKRATISGNTFFNTASTSTDINEATAGINLAVGANNYTSNGSGTGATKVLAAGSSGLVWDDPDVSFTFANLPTNLADGSRLKCSDCQNVKVINNHACTAGGGGAVAAREAGTWNCPFAPFAAQDTAGTVVTGTTNETTVATTTISTPTTGTSLRIHGAVRCTGTGTTRVQVYVSATTATVGSTFTPVSTSVSDTGTQSCTANLNIIADVVVNVPGASGAVSGMRQAGSSGTITSGQVNTDLSASPTTVNMTVTNSAVGVSATEQVFKAVVQ